MDDRTLLDLIGTSSHTYAEKGEIVYEQGDEPEAFFLILHGRCSVNVNNFEHLDIQRNIFHAKMEGKRIKEEIDRNEVELNQGYELKRKQYEELENRYRNNFNSLKNLLL